VEKLKAESKATAESITKETQTAVTKSFNFFSARGTGCRGSICILHKQNPLSFITVSIT
jgi:hypothetical protein